MLVLTALKTFEAVLEVVVDDGSMTLLWEGYCRNNCIVGIIVIVGTKNYCCSRNNCCRRVSDVGDKCEGLNIHHAADVDIAACATSCIELIWATTLLKTGTKKDPATRIWKTKNLCQLLIEWIFMNNGYPLQVSCGPRFDDNYLRIRHDSLHPLGSWSHWSSRCQRWPSEGDGESKRSNSETHWFVGTNT